MMTEKEKGFYKTVLKTVLYSFLGLVLIVLSFKVFENVNADEILIVQSPWAGTLTAHTSAGVKFQGFGKITSYYKLDTYEFEIPVRFNDGGHGTIHGSINYELPFDNEHLFMLHSKYGSQKAIQKQLVEVVTNKCVYMTGPLMSSKESYAEKRTSLITFIEDQISYGVYATIQREVKTRDPITGNEKTVTIVEIMKDSSGMPKRQEEAVLLSYGIKTSNFAVSQLPYDATVENQIKDQQKINMDVQTAMADAKKAEQNVITITKNGEASAAQAKWEQEVIKAKEVTAAQQRQEVAKLDMQAAEYTKKKEILLGEGEATRKRLVMQADGALNPKLAAVVEITKNWAENLGKFQGNLVPSVIMGGGSGAQSTSVNDLINLITAQTAKQVGVDLGITGVKNTQ